MHRPTKTASTKSYGIKLNPNEVDLAVLPVIQSSHYNTHIFDIEPDFSKLTGDIILVSMGGKYRVRSDTY